MQGNTIPSFLHSFFSFFLLSIIHPFHSFLPPFLNLSVLPLRHSFIPSFLLDTCLFDFVPLSLSSSCLVPSFLPSFVRSFLRSFLPTVIHSFIHSFIHLSLYLHQVQSNTLPSFARAVFLLNLFPSSGTPGIQLSRSLQHPAVGHRCADDHERTRHRIGRTARPGYRQAPVVSIATRL